MAEIWSGKPRTCRSHSPEREPGRLTSEPAPGPSSSRKEGMGEEAAFCAGPPRLRKVGNYSGLISDHPALIINSLQSAPVAQLDRASDFESAGRPFESGR